MGRGFLRERLGFDGGFYRNYISLLSGASSAPRPILPNEASALVPPLALENVHVLNDQGRVAAARSDVTPMFEFDKKPINMITYQYDIPTTN